MIADRRRSARTSADRPHQQAARELFGNTNPDVPVPDAWPMQHPVAYTLIWVAIILAVFAPVSIRRYERAAG